MSKDKILSIKCKEYCRVQKGRFGVVYNKIKKS